MANMPRWWLTYQTTGRLDGLAIRRTEAKRFSSLSLSCGESAESRSVRQRAIQWGRETSRLAYSIGLAALDEEQFSFHLVEAEGCCSAVQTERSRVYLVDTVCPAISLRLPLPAMTVLKRFQIETFNGAAIRVALQTTFPVALRVARELLMSGPSSC